MKRKGFTLIELLAVIVVLAIIAMIAIPTILGVIDKAEKGAFRSSVLGIMEAADFYRATNTINYDEEGIITFNCNGEECASDQGKLSFKGEVPIKGSIILTKDGKVEAYYLQNKEYCALGERTNLDVRKDCNSLDITEPALEVRYVKSTTNKIIISVNTSDNESGIKKIRYEIEDRIIEDKYEEIGSVEVNKEIENLEPNKEYSIKVIVTNGNDKTNEYIVEGTTLLVNSPTVKIEGNKISDGYYESITANIVYDNTNIESPEYFIKSTKNGVSSINLLSVCGEENEPEECTNIEETNILETDIWYKVGGNLNVVYNEASTETGDLYVLIYDGVNYIGSNVTNIPKISYKASEIEYTTSYNENINNIAEAIDDLTERVENLK